MQILPSHFRTLVCYAQQAYRHLSALPPALRGCRHSLFHLKCKGDPLGPVTAALCPQVGAGRLAGQQCSQVTPFSAPTRGVNRQPGLQAMRPVSAALTPAHRLPCAPAGMRELRRCGGRMLPGRSDVLRVCGVPNVEGRVMECDRA